MVCLRVLWVPRLSSGEDLRREILLNILVAVRYETVSFPETKHWKLFSFRRNLCALKQMFDFFLKECGAILFDIFYVSWELNWPLGFAPVSGALWMGGTGLHHDMGSFFIQRIFYEPRRKYDFQKFKACFTNKWAIFFVQSSLGRFPPNHHFFLGLNFKSLLSNPPFL